jgi:hypothetical protein
VYISRAEYHSNTDFLTSFIQWRQF